MDRDWIMDQRPRPPFSQNASERFPGRRPHHVLVIDVERAGLLAWPLELRFSQPFIILSGDETALLVFLGQVFEFSAQNGRLKFIQAAVHAGEPADIAFLPAVLPQQPGSLSDSSVIRDNGS